MTFSRFYLGGNLFGQAFRILGFDLSPPQALPLGFLIKIAIIEKPCALIFSLSPTPPPPQHKEAFSEERGLDERKGREWWNKI